MSVLILDETYEVIFPLHTKVSIHSLPLHFGIIDKGTIISKKINFVRHVRILKKKIKQLKADIVISSEYPFTIAAQLALKSEKIPLFSWEHHHFHHLKKSRFWQLLFKKSYPKINGVVCLNDDESKLFQEIGCKTFVIPNFTPIASTEKAGLDQKQLLTIGWFTKTKGIDLIPGIAEKIFNKYPDWKWKIIGQGEEAHGLKNILNVELRKPVLNIEEQYLNSSIYILPSRFECFPMVLLEAMSFGVPCIAFDCPTGPRHIIKNGEDGILIEKENTETMANAIIGLIENSEKRKRLGANAFENIKRFSPENVYQLWERLFNDDRNSERTSE